MYWSDNKRVISRNGCHKLKLKKKKIILPNLKNREKERERERYCYASLHAQKPFLYQKESH